ncbi:MAG: thiamine-phosphate kinase [Kiritimatiellia bacterium]
MQSTNATLSELGERRLIARLRRQTADGGDVAVGIGDDCAVVRLSADAAEDLVLKSDPVICGHHFLPDAPPRLIGHKALGRVLSDIASMGAAPRWILVNLVAPGDTPVRVIDEAYAGMSALAREHGCAIIGGDTCRGETFEFHVFGCGTLPRGSARLRSGAKAGDVLRVTGRLGGSLVSGSHLSFAPRVREGQWLRDRANAMIDISDGLASELWHLARESRAALVLDPRRVPFSPAAAGAADPLRHALFDGEDFELLFSVPPDRERDFDAAWQAAFPELPCTRIGEVAGSGEADVRLANGAPLPEGGFDHFISPVQWR